MGSRLRRPLLTAAAIVMFLVLAGATYQGAATALERRQFPHPGRLIDVGGHQLHIHCTGEGSPTVVLEAPATGMSAAWGWVQPAVADETRTCSYDRAGMGWSEAGDRPYDPDKAVEELHALLERADEPRPYVMAGHGLGASLAALYASRFGGDVAAVVLIDAPAPAEGDRARLTRFMRLSPWLARTGLLRATGMLSSSADGLPEPSGGALSAFLNRPDHLTRAARELALWDEAVARAADAPQGDEPLVRRIEATGPARVAFLTDEEQAAAVSRQIIDVVAEVRQRR